MGTPKINYTDRDFSTIKEALKIHIQNRFPDTWKDFYESNAGMALLELVAYVYDNLSYYLDAMVNEAFLPTAQDRLSMIFLGELVGYTLTPPTSASVVLTGTLPAVQAVDIVYPVGTEITSIDGVKFRVLEEQRISAGNLTGGITVVEGESAQDVFTSDGTSLQKFTLTKASAVEGSIEVLVNGEEWTESESLVYGDDESEIYALRYDANDYAEISFGDGTSGAIPPNGATITVNYRIGGGLQGNIAIGRINTTMEGEKEGITPTEIVTTSVTNEERGSGGEERETIEHARLWMPRWVKTNGRAVTEEDFDTLANTFSDPIYGAPAAAKARLKQDIPELNTVELFLWARDSGGNIVEPSQNLKDAVEDYFTNNGTGAVRVICTDVEVLDGEIIYIDFDVSVKPTNDYAQGTVLSNVNDAIAELFTEEIIQPGTPVRISKVYNAIQDALGVDYGVINFMIASKEYEDSVGTGDGGSANYTGTLTNIPIAHTVTITDGTQVVTDDGNGNLTGDIDASGPNTVNYETGEYDVTFASNVASGVSITATYRYMITYQRGELAQTADGTSSRFQGTVQYPPLVEGTMAFTDGSQVVTDDGNGNVIGDVDPTGNNTIDYDTGAYDFKFQYTPASGLSIRSTYVQNLNVNSEDIPIDKNQFAVQGRITVTALDE